jgi:hypothetical protein
MLWPLALVLAVAASDARRLDRASRQLLLIALPLLVAPAFWVKDHGSFFLPLGLVLSLLCPLLLQKWTQGGRWTANLAAGLLFLLIAGNLQHSWQLIAYDRGMGLSQVSYCQRALTEMPENSRVLSTALLSTWLFVKENSGRSDIECQYFPWLLRSDYSSVIEQSLEELCQTPGVYYVDQTVSTAVAQTGRLLEVKQIAVPDWPQGQVFWDLKAVYLGDAKEDHAR